MLRINPTRDDSSHQHNSFVELGLLNKFSPWYFLPIISLESRPVFTRTVPGGDRSESLCHFVCLCVCVFVCFFSLGPSPEGTGPSLYVTLCVCLFVCVFIFLCVFLFVCKV